MEAMTSPRLLTTPAARRRRRSSGDADEKLLDSMLSELGIPTSDKKRRQAAAEVVELLTPPRRRRGDEEAKSELENSVLDLTTPTPPSNKRGSGPALSTPPPRASRQSIVDLLSPDGPEPEPTLDSDTDEEELAIGPESDHETRRPLLVMSSDEERAEESDEEAILRALDEVQTRIRLPPSNESRSLSRRLDERIRGTVNEEKEDDESNEQAPKKRGRKKKTPAPPKPAKEVVLAAVAMERRLAASPVGAAVTAALAANVYNNKPVRYVLEEAFMSDLNVIQWERRGDKAPGDDASRFMIAMHYPAEAFLDLLVNHGYDALLGAVKWLSEETLNMGREKRVVWGSIVLIVEGMDRALITRSKKSKSKSNDSRAQTASSTELAITFSDLHDLAFRIYMDTSVHTKFTCDVEATATYIALLTRELIVAAVKQSSQEEFLESVPRLHSFRVLRSSGSTLNPFANSWLRMLQMIPNVSEDRAQSILDHFPTFETLMRAYSNPSTTQQAKEELLADKLHANRIESALSRRIYRVFSAWDENVPV